MLGGLLEVGEGRSVVEIKFWVGSYAVLVHFVGAFKFVNIIRLECTLERTSKE